MYKYFLSLLTLLSSLSFCSYQDCVKAVYLSPSIFDNVDKYKKIEEMNEEEFDEFCEDAKKMPGNGYRDSKDAAEEAEYHQKNTNFFIRIFQALKR